MSASLSCTAGKLAWRVNRRADAIGNGTEGTVTEETGQGHENARDREQDALRRSAEPIETEGNDGNPERDPQNAMPGWDIGLVEHGASFFAVQLEG